MKELIEIGFWEGFFAFEVQPLNQRVWAAMLTGFLVQYFVCKKAKKAWIKWIFPTLLLVGIAVCEYMSWVITGWDLFVVLIVYWGILCLAIGAGIAEIVYKLRKEGKDKCRLFCF